MTPEEILSRADLPEDVRQAVARALEDVEAERRSSDQRHRELIESLSDVVFSVDLEGTLTEVSAAVERVLGYTPAEMVGRNIRDLIHPEDLERALAGFRDVLGGQAAASEYRIRARAGTTAGFGPRVAPCAAAAKWSA